MTLDLLMRDTRLRTVAHTCGAPKPAAQMTLVAEMTAALTTLLLATEG